MVRGTQLYDGGSQREVDMAYLLSSQIVSPAVRVSGSTSPERNREGKLVPRLSLSTDGGSLDDVETVPYSEVRQTNRLMRSRMKGAQKRHRRRGLQRRGSAAPQHIAAFGRGFESTRADQQHLHFNSLAESVRVGFSVLNLVRLMYIHYYIFVYIFSFLIFHPFSFHHF